MAAPATPREVTGKTASTAQSAPPASTGSPKQNLLNNGTIVGSLTVDGAYVSIANALKGPTVVEDGSGYVSAIVNWTTPGADGPSAGAVDWKIVSGSTGPALSDFTSWTGVGPAGTFKSATSGRLHFSAEGNQYAYTDLRFTPQSDEPRNETFTIDLYDPSAPTVLGSPRRLKISFVNPLAAGSAIPPPNTPTAEAASDPTGGGTLASLHEQIFNSALLSDTLAYHPLDAIGGRGSAIGSATPDLLSVGHGPGP